MYNPIIVEHEILKFWEKNKTFEKLRKKNKGKKVYSFFDGPITANNPMGVHHAWGRTYKDLYQRWKAMQGYDQRYQNGFDCQGLWVEVEVEKELGFNSKRDIENYGLAKFSEACRKRVEKYSTIQAQESKRLGQWMDWNNSYFTLTDNNIEHIWYFLKKCHEKGWLYEDTRVMPWCTRCGTSLSQHELLDGYDDMIHTAVYFKLPLKGKQNEFFLAWTTTPWTLTANVALAVNPNLLYVKVKKGNEVYYLSEKTKSKLLKEEKILEKLKGKQLINREYEGPFDYLPVQKKIKHKVIAWDAVGEEEGTGIVHIAPGCGAEDNELGKKENLPEIAPIDEYGNYIDGFEWLTGKNVKHILKPILEDLEKNRFLFKTEQYKHRYPKCWRCKEELVFRQVSEWFIAADEIRPRMKHAAEQVSWSPEHASKLMQDWLNNMGDWCISRKRYWGLPLPIWKCSCGHTEIIGSVKELKQKSVSKTTKIKELHRPWIDEILIKCPACQEKASRIPEVGDCWLDAGIVPFSTLKYLQDKKYWKKWFPAEFITEMREQIRLWFYSMLFMAVTLEDTNPYRSVLVYEKVHDEKGNPMHKSAGNAIWFSEAVDKIGADVMRWMYANQNPKFNLNFGYTPAREAKRKLDVIWNLGNYVNLYCKDSGRTESKTDIVSKWILSRRETTKQKVTEWLEKREPQQAIKEIETFLVEDLSRGYGQFIRDGLHHKNIQAILKNSFIEGLKLLAPFLPFMTEKLYQELGYKTSIFLESWPKPKAVLINLKLEKQMKEASNVIQLILAEREKIQMGVRWPLTKAKIVLNDPVKERAIKTFEELIKKQTNVKQIVIEKTKTVKMKVTLDTKLTPELEKEGYTRELIRRIQDLRKKAGLRKEDKILLQLEAPIPLDTKTLQTTVGAKSIGSVQKPSHKEICKVKEKEFKIAFKKV